MDDYPSDATLGRGGTRPQRRRCVSRETCTSDVDEDQHHPGLAALADIALELRDLCHIPSFIHTVIHSVIHRLITSEISPNAWSSRGSPAAQTQAEPVSLQADDFSD